MHRFLPALASGIGVTIVEMPVNHRARQHGKSKYGISRTLRVILDLLTVKFILNYSTQPLQIFGTAGAGDGTRRRRACLATLERCGSCTSSPSCSACRSRCWASLLLFTGVQFVTLGLLAELQARNYHESAEPSELRCPRSARVAGRGLEFGRLKPDYPSAADAA